MGIFRSLVLMAGIALVLFAIGSFLNVSVNIGGGATTQADGSFQSQLSDPIRLAIVGDPDAAEDMRSQILKNDRKGIVNPDVVPADLADADAVLYLLDGWADIKTAPWQDTLRSDYAIIAANTDDSFAISMYDGDRPLGRVYYNLNLYNGWNSDCYARLFLHEVGTGPGEVFYPTESCPI